MANCFLSWLVVPRSRISTGLLNVQTIWLLSPCSFSCLTPMINIRLQMETFYKLKTTTTTKLSSLSSSRTTKEKSISGTSWNVDCILKGWVRSMKWLRRSSSSFLTTSSSSSNLSLKLLSEYQTPVQTVEKNPLMNLVVWTLKSRIYFSKYCQT